MTRATGVTLIADEIQIDWGARIAAAFGESGLDGGSCSIRKELGWRHRSDFSRRRRGEVLNELPHGSESETFACTPLAAAVATEVLQQLETGGWVEKGSLESASVSARR